MVVDILPNNVDAYQKIPVQFNLQSADARRSRPLEAKSSLKFDRSSPQSRLRLAEKRIAGSAVGADHLIDRVGRQRRKVRLIQDVEEVGAELKSGSLAEDPEAGHAESLGQSGVDVQEVRPL